VHTSWRKHLEAAQLMRSIMHASQLHLSAWCWDLPQQSAAHTRTLVCAVSWN